MLRKMAFIVDLRCLTSCLTPFDSNVIEWVYRCPGFSQWFFLILSLTMCALTISSADSTYFLVPSMHSSQELQVQRGIVSDFYAFADVYN